MHVAPKGSLAEWSESLARSVWPHVWHRLRSPGRKGWATIFQLIGAVVTFAALSTAWSPGGPGGRAYRTVDCRAGDHRPPLHCYGRSLRAFAPMLYVIASTVGCCCHAGGCGAFELAGRAKHAADLTRLAARRPTQCRCRTARRRLNRLSKRSIVGLPAGLAIRPRCAGFVHATRS